MKLIECLTQLPPDLKMIDLSATGTNIKTVSEIINTLSDNHKNEEGYELRERKSNYGKTTVKSIGIIGSVNLFNEAG